MRLRRLTLERYGAFNGRRLDFAPGAALHLVFGANEAGKTTALAAVGDLLYGIEERTRFNFLHANEELRLGAELAARDGRSLAFRRRKGRRRTLLDEADAALPDELLQPWLAGVGREVFQQGFGLSQEGLRRGGEAMLAAEGEIGRSLFAAASGLTGLVELRQGLATEAEALYRRNSRGTTRFDALRKAHDEARAELRARSVGAEAWRELAERVAAGEAALLALETERAALRQERVRLARIRRTAPLLRQLDQERDAAHGFAALPDLPTDFTARVEAALARHGEAARDAAGLAEEEAQAERRLAALPRHPVLLRAAARIDVLVERLEVLREIDRDLPKREAGLAEADAALADFARRLGLGSAAALLTAEPSDPQRSRVRRLLAEGTRLATKAEAARREREEKAATLTQAEALCRTLPAVPEPDALRLRLAALRPEVEALLQRARQQAELAQRRAALAEAARRLSPPVSALDALAGLSLPSAVAIRAAATDAAALAAEAGDRKTLRRALQDSLVQEERTLAELAAGGELPTAEALRRARDARDRLWREARPFVLPEPLPALEAEARRSLARGLDEALEQADRLADRREADSDRVARHLDAGRRRQDLARQIEALEREAADLAERQARLAADWQALWHRLAAPPLALSPGSPAEMLPWLAEAERLLRHRDEMAAAEAGLAAQRSGEEELRQALRALCADAGVAALDEEPPRLLRGLDAALARLDAAWQRQRDAQTALRRAREDVELLPPREAALAAEQEAWRQAWAEALPAVGLTPEAGEPEAEAALTVWSAVPEARTRRQMSAERVERMRRALQEARAQTGELLAEVAPEAAGLPLVPAIEDLRRRCAEARAADSRVRQVQEEAARLRQRLDAARSALAQTQAELAELAAEAGLLAEIARDEGEARGRLAALVPALQARWAARAALARLQAQLAEQGDGLAEATLREEGAALPIDAAIARADELDARDAALGDEMTELHLALRAAREEQARLEAGRGADRAAQDEADALAGLAGLARDYLRLEAARALIATALERHRARYQDPLLNRASALFARLTGGAFAGLATDYGSDDQPLLAAQRAGDPEAESAAGGGQRVPVAGLSEGTRDQLYLALRLAALTAFAEGADPPPFLCDDLLVSFDDGRAAWALDALAETGASLQVILFTHHRHVVELARARLGERLDLIEL